MTDTIYEQLLAERASYHQPDTTSSTPPEDPMGLAQIEQDIRTGIDDVVTRVTGWADAVKPHLGELADLAQNVEESPLVQSALAAVLPPSVEQELAALIDKLHDQFNTTPAPPQPEAATEPAPVQPNMQAGDPQPVA